MAIQKKLEGVAQGVAQLRWRIEQRRHAGKEAPVYVQFVLDGAYADLPPERLKWWQGFLPQNGQDLRSLREQFKRVAQDERVDGVVLHLRGLALSLAQLQQLRSLVGELRSAGKRVVAWSPNYTTASYYVACAADEILVMPGGSVAPVGLHSKLVNIKDTLDEIGVQMDAVQTSSFKTGPDVFTQSQPTEASREMANWLLDDQFALLLEGIAEGRSITVEAAKQLIDNAPYTDLQAHAANVVDGILNEEALPAHLGLEDEAKPGVVPWEQAEEAVLPLKPPAPTERHVALLRVEGMIVPGESRRPPLRSPLLSGPVQTGDLSMVQRIRALRDDESVGAVVLWVNSPGGSATASEAITSALQQIAAEKPLVVAMGAVAASGGYYVATPAHWIVAQPSTMTGSIGVFTLKPVLTDLLDKLQVGRESLTRGRHANIFDIEKPFDEEAEEKIEESIRRTYDLFVERVAASRTLPVEAVDEIGGGRVWTGRQALHNGLVDELGGLELAIEKARALAQLPSESPLKAVAPPKAALGPSLAPQVAWSWLLAHPGQPLCLSPFWWDGGTS